MRPNQIALKRCLLAFLPTLLFLYSVASEKELLAVKATESIKIDGHFSESVWKQAPVATDFIINSPNYGAPSVYKTEVRILYSEQAIYVGAYLYDDGSLIRKQLTPRDGEQRQDIDYFSVFFDTYNDDQNAFQFVVTARNVQSDGRLSPSVTAQFGAPSDYTWDAVWESKVTMQKDGWVVEMKIPYSALRFAKKDKQDWGINFQRYVRRTNESSYWNTIDPNQSGFVNQFGKLRGIENIEPPVRLSFLPYVTAGVRTTPLADGRDTKYLRNGGIDLKYGLNESFTLDMTLIPDFGQTISDNVVLNLTPYEVYFTENRPFFTEGTELFNKAGLFYSRRVGATPEGYYDVRSMMNDSIHVLSNPGVTQLINATKFSGRTRNNLGIGVFNAVEAPMNAKLENINTGRQFKVETEPLSNFNVLVLDQALKNRSYITFTNTNVLRNGNARDANVSGIDLALFDRKNRNRFAAKAVYSKIFGNDAYDGWKTSFSYGKVSGRWQYDLTSNIVSEKFDPNDLGYLATPNEITTQGTLSYNIFTPTKNFISQSYTAFILYQNYYKPNSFAYTEARLKGFWYFKNFWDLTISLISRPVEYNDLFELRTAGRMLKRPSVLFAGINGSSDSRKRLFVRWNFRGWKVDLPNSPFYSIQLGARYRFSDRFSLDLDMKRDYEQAQIGYAGRETNGEPFIGRRKNTNFTSLLTGVYNFTPRMNLSMRARHYWSRVDYVSFYNVDNDGNWIQRSFASGLDQNFNAFNLDMFFTWDFKYGSRFIAGWKNSLADDFPVDGISNKNYFDNIGRTLGNPHANEFTVRLIYYIDYLQLQRRKPRLN